MLLVLQQEAPHTAMAPSEFLTRGENACERSSDGINKILFPGETRIQLIAQAGQLPESRSEVERSLRWKAGAS